MFKVKEDFVNIINIWNKTKLMQWYFSRKIDDITHNSKVLLKKILTLFLKNIKIKLMYILTLNF